MEDVELDIVEMTDEMKRTVGKRQRFTLARRIADWMLDAPELNIENNPRVFDNDSLISYLMNSPYEMPDCAYGFPCDMRNWEDIRRYACFIAMAGAIRSALMPGSES